MSFINSIKEKLHQKYKNQEIKNHNLQYLFLEITKRCNLNCLHCGSDCSKEINGSELTTNSWYKIIDYFHQYYNHIAFIITGGEPLVHKDIYNIGSYIKSKNMRWGMVTNGFLLDEQKLEKLIDSGISSITLSLDGNKNSHNWLRNHPNAFSKAINALKLIAASKIKYKDIVTCVSPKNFNDLDELAELFVNEKINNWRIFRIFPSGRAEINKQLALSFEQTQNLLQWIEEHKPKLAKRGLNLNLSCEGWIPFHQDKKVRDTPFFCRSGINVASILSDGTITGCNNNHKSFYLGSIIKDNFSKIWNNDFSVYREKEWLNNTYCNECEYLSNCKGGSMHLWNKNEKQPNFCYVKNLKG